MSILVYIEQREGTLRPVSLEALGEATRLAASLGGPVVAVYCGATDANLASLGEAGADQVLVAKHAAFAHYDGAGYAAAVAAAARATEASVVLLAASSIGKDLAPRVAALLGVGLASDCTALDTTGGKLVARRPIMAGKLFEKLAFPLKPAMATLRPKAFAPAAPAAGKSASTSALAFEWDASAPRAVVTGVTGETGGKADLTEAEIIVSGGRGMKGPENFALIEKLAEALGATVGASRAVVDAGWRPHGDQVGQTGKTVSPKLYVAVGISGAIQHLAGMSSSRCIVAINKDPEAPIFKLADYGLVGDLFEVVPALTEAVKKVR